jgi:hypothetical protein
MHQSLWSKYVEIGGKEEISTSEGIEKPKMKPKLFVRILYQVILIVKKLICKVADFFQQ